jgi:2'-5' RNA ligase
VLGVAIEIPSPWAEQLRAARLSYGDTEAQAVPPHITLLPPTTIDDAVRDEVLAHLVEVANRTSPFAVLLRGAGTFRPVSPVVFVVVAQGISECEQLERGVRSGPLERPVGFPYHPHVTIAHDVADAELDRAFTDFSDFSAEFTVDVFRLYSHVGSGWVPDRDLSLRG